MLRKLGLPTLVATLLLFAFTALVMAAAPPVPPTIVAGNGVVHAMYTGQILSVQNTGYFTTEGQIVVIKGAASISETNAVTNIWTSETEWVVVNELLASGYKTVRVYYVTEAGIGSDLYKKPVVIYPKLSASTKVETDTLTINLEWSSAASKDSVTVDYGDKTAPQTYDGIARKVTITHKYDKKLKGQTLKLRIEAQSSTSFEDNVIKQIAVKP